MINQNKMTAVEFIRKEFLEKLTNENYKKSVYEIFEQAKEMEKDQIEMAFFKGKTFGMNLPDGLTAEQDYKLTFKSE